jgi:hypothetical protein
MIASTPVVVIVPGLLFSLVMADLLGCDGRAAGPTLLVGRHADIGAKPRPASVGATDAAHRHSSGMTPHRVLRRWIAQSVETRFHVAGNAAM